MGEAILRGASNDRGALLLLLYTNAREAAGLVGHLSAEGDYEVVTCPLSQPAGRLIEELQPDLILLEPPSHEELVPATCETVRRLTERPIVVLSDQGSELAITRALAAGADEYLVLPIGAGELIARISALVRRMSGNNAGNGTIEVGGLTLVPDDQSAELGDRKVFLSPIEFRLLSCLVTSYGKVVTHDALMSRVWGAEYVDSRHYLHLYIRYLREKLEPDPASPRMILSEWGIGYRFQPIDPMAS